ncbi:Cys-tRNA(Pro) deacylase [Oerskovia flava]|uniref:Cys-tRNA(Pro) deacylase n=1 Tax=Oerskovia flava TaxID=2986422 RepID=UPI0022405673|nr:Cys-tRNA(Pro) deacylase [Oerskovia sp. JB1-3-2]
MAKKQKTGAHAGTPAVVALTAAGVPHTLHPYEHDPTSEVGYGLEAAAAIGVEPAQVFKTLVASVEGNLVVGIVPVDRMLDLKALAQAVGAKKATLADQAAAERATGYVVGGISPLGQRQRLRTVLDASAGDHDVVYVSGGRRGLDVGLAPADLVRLTGAVTAPVARPTRENPEREVEPRSPR